MNAAVAPRILIVDDNAENRALAQATLEDEGYQVVLATGGNEGIQAFEANHFDCVLLDVRMPVTDGFAVCSKIRALPGGGETPIVFLTALRDVDTFDQALRAGGDDFLAKPVRPTELVLRVQAALKIRKMSGELRDSYALLRRQRDDLMRLQLQKERLTAFVVHDLKNPVNAIDLHAQVLLGDRSLSPTARESAQHIRSEAKSLLRLLFNLLDISKSEEGRLVAKRETVQLEGLVAEVFETFELKAKTAAVTLACRIEAPTLMGDRDLLQRVIENLIDNAIRHAPAGSQVRFTSAARAQSVALCVADAGAGIDPAQREMIFERFVQLESGQQSSARAGRGLGLAFCKLAVEAQGGTIVVEPGDPGAVFVASIPQC